MNHHHNNECVSEGLARYIAADKAEIHKFRPGDNCRPIFLRKKQTEKVPDSKSKENALDQDLNQHGAIGIVMTISNDIMFQKRTGHAAGDQLRGQSLCAPTWSD
eukprot:gnl/MRDRNA2_/MRDRNA2_192422_c0_seq1.p1 gnl/MRDRNA2_/MRDRNA2_192422_c0~~gnl/MRDRNA2_/MRDRNA2_192422_c0_seq1.p1  ORF type:complete len:104 (+),score=5.53 gnl/MRDRNA2_/MRDRNA2_192422_c0_seq1:181-492(+)